MCVSLLLEFSQHRGYFLFLLSQLSTSIPRSYSSLGRHRNRKADILPSGLVHHRPLEVYLARLGKRGGVGVGSGDFPVPSDQVGSPHFSGLPDPQRLERDV